MEDMSEGDLLPKNLIKVYIFTILSIIIWRRGGEGRWRGGEGEEVREEGRRWREYIFIILSRCLSVFAVM